MKFCHLKGIAGLFTYFDFRMVVMQRVKYQSKKVLKEKQRTIFSSNFTGSESAEVVYKA